MAGRPRPPVPLQCGSKIKLNYSVKEKIHLVSKASFKFKDHLRKNKGKLDNMSEKEICALPKRGQERKKLLISLK